LIAGGKMDRFNPKRILVIGFILVLFGFVGPFLMVLNILPKTFFLSFLSYGSSIAGLFLGVVGTASMVRIRRKEYTPDNFPDTEEKKKQGLRRDIN
jgi:hypothetical protein